MKNRYITWRIFRENCFLTAEGYYVKDLRILEKDKVWKRRYGQ